MHVRDTWSFSALSRVVLWRFESIIALIRSSSTSTEILNYLVYQPNTSSSELKYDRNSSRSKVWIDQVFLAWIEIFANFPSFFWSRKKEREDRFWVLHWRKIVRRRNARFRIRSAPLILRINYPLRWSVMREMRRDMRYSSWNVCMPRAYHWPSGMGGVCSFRIRCSRMPASILLSRHFIRIIRTGYRHHRLSHVTSSK